MARALDVALGANGSLLAVLTVDQLPRPAQLPLAMSGFVGREAEIRDLTAALERPADSRVPLIIAVDGPPGAGKTTLALHFAHKPSPASRTASCTPTCAGTARTTGRRCPRRCWPTCCARSACRPPAPRTWSTWRRCTGPRWPSGGC
ncbi:ATP-binding protein [Kutzneria kofuensis]|uniref:ATP-binding protein n=1 Tax=Kutzneria kofuensis TaxID=103725 RepID=UPI0031F092F3